ncbi:hypothetical protein V1460_28400 [Streptomyces sp. SCSIO 30461]|uniref:hypothetical protein n=1 Tax=Streptomyces sp. SCSIO 30461 TaxID=3118085 RepID=UPI0030CE8B90
MPDWSAQKTSEPAPARELFDRLGQDDLLLADRGFTGLDLWRGAASEGADLLWRIRSRDREGDVREDSSRRPLDRWSRGSRTVRLTAWASGG